ncbi:MAG: T9SS type A sorting domain-containing protein [Saprospiraceae bacterium]
MMKKFFTLLLLLAGWQFASAQITYEDFESGASVSWVGLNGTYNGVVANPDPSGNSSAFVGSYTNAPAFDFCFALGTLPAPVDLSEYNLVRMKIWSPTAPAKALLKFEGGGNAVEKFVDITVANQWVEYEFDLSAGAAKTGMDKILVSFNSFVLGDDKTYYFDDIVAVKNERCYNDFEGPSLLNFQGLDGVLTAPEPNPGANQINGSANCAKYVKSGAHAYSLILADNGAPFDLTTYNVFKIKVYATAPTSMIFKIEGTGGGFEKRKNIAVTNAWQEYYFDFSAQAANTGLSKIVMFFDPGVETSTDTYYFDDVCAVPSSCVGATADPNVLDDFECNRNATYALGWDSLHVVKNPQVNGDNPSAKVGQWRDPAGPGTEWAALVLDNDDPIDLSTRNQFSLQMWAPRTGKLLMKLEGGAGPAKEVFADVTETNKWVTYTADFSAQAGAGHKKFVLFFNAGVNGDAGDVYYFDNVKLTAPTAAPPLEDFEGGIHLGWQPLDQNTVLHGNFTAPTNNPTPGGSNTSASVGCYSKGASAFSTLQAFSLTAFDLSAFAQFNLDVLAPAGGGEVTMQLSSPTQGNKEAKATVKTPGAWETLSFDFSAHSAITDFQEVRLIFNSGTAASGESWCIDNLRQSEVTVDPCAGVAPVPNIVDDFECQRNYTKIFYGDTDIKVVNNPHLAPENPSLKVGEYKDPANQPWAGIGFEFPAAFDLSVLNQLECKIWSPNTGVPVLFKLEGSGAGVEVFKDITEKDKWVKYKIDFSAANPTQHTKLVIFIGAGVDGPGATYFIDDLKWVRAGYNGCIDDHETAASSISNFKYFANGSLEAQGYTFEIVDNPNPSGINLSTKVGKFVKAGDGAPFAGMYADLGAPIDFKGVKTMKAKVHMDHIGNFAIKLEGSATGVPAIELPVANTKTNQWEELTYDFSSVPDNAEYQRLTLFFDLSIDATGQDVTSYFDDLVVGTGSCAPIIGVFNPLPVEALVVSPNPASDLLRIENFGDVARLDIFNAYGQRVASVNASGDLRTEIDVTRFATGVYTIAGRNDKGLLIGNAKFVKQ